MKTYKTVLYTLVKAQSDKVLDCLASSEYPENSDMVVYIHQLLKVKIIIKYTINLLNNYN